MQNNLKRRGLSFLLILAMLFVSFAVMLPVATSADPAEFDDEGVQTLSSFNLQNDADTDLRFLFTICRLDYDEVGFVFSKSVAEPTTSTGYKVPVDTAYTTVMANGAPIEAPAGRYYVAVKMTDVPRSYFDGTLYVRPYVVDGGVTRYDDVAITTVCKAAGHNAHTINEFDHEMIGGTAAMNVTGTKIGHCSVCNLDNVTQYDTTTELEHQRWLAGGSTSWVDSRQFSEILAGGKHFYPDASNGFEGNDLYAEMSVLWNESLLNFSGSAAGGARLETMFSNNKQNSTTYDNTKAIFYLSLTNNVSNSGSKIFGAIEYACSELATSEAGNPYPDMNKNERSFSDYPNLGGTSQNYPEWGWHRIGIKYHEDVTNLSDVESSGADAEYKLTVTLYIDGEVVSILSGTDLVQGGKDYKLYTVEKVDDDLVYTDINGNYWFLLMKMTNFAAEGQDVYFIDGDLFVTCGQSFVQQVTRIDNPAARTEVVNGQNFNGAFYYTTVGAHDHVWGELENDASHAADCGTPATQSIHCTVCGATKPASTVDLPIDPNLHNWGVTPVRIQEPTLLVDGIDRYTCTVCGAHDDRAVSYEHDVQKWTNSSKNNTWVYGERTVGQIRSENGNKQFYTAGNDLLVEYSVLWNETVENISGGSYNSYIDTRFGGDNTGTDGKNIIYWSVGSGLNQSDCEWAGGFEWGGIPKSDVGNPYPKFTSSANNGGLGLGTTRDEYPNIGGNNPGSGLPQGDTQWGWHRVSIRYREEVTNVDDVKNGTAAQYRLTMWVYIDGTLVIKAYNTDLISDKSVDRKLFSASGGDGNITYTPNDSQYFLPIRLNNRRVQSGTTVYFEIADLNVTIGSDFVQNVRKATSPTPATLEVEKDVFVTSTMWYELDD